MTTFDAILAGQWLFLAYFVGINAGYLAQNLLAILSIRRYLRNSDVGGGGRGVLRR